MGDVEEGKVGFFILSRSRMLIFSQSCMPISEVVLDYSVLFAEIADVYFEREMHLEAKPICDLLGGDPSPALGQVDIHYLINWIFFCSMHEKIRRIARSH